MVTRSCPHTVATNCARPFCTALMLQWLKAALIGSCAPTSRNAFTNDGLASYTSSTPGQYQCMLTPHASHICIRRVHTVVLSGAKCGDQGRQHVVADSRNVAQRSQYMPGVVWPIVCGQETE